MSIVYFTQEKPSPFRGIDISNIILELLAITQWGRLDFLIIDMPPGIGDETLDCHPIYEAQRVFGSDYSFKGRDGSGQ